MGLSALACALLLFATPGDEARARVPAVQITVAGGPAVSQGLLDAMPEFTDGFGVPTEFHRTESMSLDAIVDPPRLPPPAHARVWIDVTSQDRARIVIIDAAYERMLIRNVQLEAGLDEVARDEIGYIVELSVEALLAGGAIGVTREVAREQLRTVRKQPPRERVSPTPVIEISAGYAARAWGRIAPLHGPLLDVGVGAALRGAHLGGAIEAQYLVPVTSDGPGLSLRLTGASLRVLFRAVILMRGPWSFDGSAGGGVDILHERARATSASAEAFEPRTRIVGDAALRLGPSVRLGRRADRVLIRLDAALDVAIRRFRYVTANEGAVVFDPWLPRPGLRLTVGWWAQR